MNDRAPLVSITMHIDGDLETTHMRTAVLYRSALALLAGAALSVSAWSAPAAQATQVAAVWVPRHIQFVYQGFTTYYSCDGLRDKIQHMLHKLGARDLKVREVPCSTPGGRPDPFPGVNVRMQVLVPAARAGKAAKSAPQVQAHWQAVVLAPDDTEQDYGGECELIEQFKRSFLPLFTTRNTRYQATCIPHQVTLGTSLSTEVLVADEPHSGKRPDGTRGAQGTQRKAAASSHENLNH